MAAPIPPRPRIVWSPDYEVDIGTHVFPTAKYRYVRDRLLGERVLSEDDFETPTQVSYEELLLVHTEEYLRKIREDQLSVGERRQLEVPFSDSVREAMILCCGGTLLTARRAMRDGVAVHLGGGFHHAYPGHGEGFCLLNDVAVAAAVVVDRGEAERALVVDLDVHHGNGTAAIFADESRVFTFSMHQLNNYPAVKPPSDRDLALDDGIGDEEYLALLGDHLPEALDEHAPQVCLYLAGADPYRLDQLGGLGLTLDGLRRRDELVLRLARERGIAIAVTMAGGYAMDERDTVAIHCATIEAALAASSAGL